MKGKIYATGRLGRLATIARFCLPWLGIVLLSLLPSSATAQSGTLPAASEARYRITFTSTWSSETHPSGNFPTTSAHFSPLIGATHSDSISLWQPGALASDGIEQMAETGATGLLTDEIDALIADGSAERVLRGSGLGSATGQVMLDPFPISADFPLVSLVTMVAPSPDWFVGVHDVSLLDEDGQWLDRLVIELDPYDAGTDSGTDYSSANSDTDPAEPIRNLRGVAPFANAPVGTFTIERVYTTFLPVTINTGNE